MSMSHKARILAAARRQPVDKLPFGARIDLWYNYHSTRGSLPAKYQGWSMLDILRDLDAGAQARYLRLWKMEWPNTEVTVRKEPPYETTEWKTPRGTVSLKTVFRPEEGTLTFARWSAIQE